jgi:hypothetical protein
MRNEYFEITSVSKGDILQAFEESDQLEQVKKRIAEIDESEMTQLAGKLAEDYCNQLFWDSLRTTFETLFL